jgi:hypothetical protein
MAKEDDLLDEAVKQLPIVWPPEKKLLSKEKALRFQLGKYLMDGKLFVVSYDALKGANTQPGW